MSGERTAAALVVLMLCACDGAERGCPLLVVLDRGGGMRIESERGTPEDLAARFERGEAPHGIRLQADEGVHWRYVEPVIRTCRAADRPVRWGEEPEKAPLSRADGAILALTRGSRGERVRVRFGEEERGDAEEDFAALTEQIAKAAPKAVQLKIDPLVPLRLVLRTIEAVRAAGAEAGIE